mgnify:CR=1 FL=1
MTDTSCGNLHSMPAPLRRWRSFPRVRDSLLGNLKTLVDLEIDLPPVPLARIAALNARFAFAGATFAPRNAMAISNAARVNASTAAKSASSSRRAASLAR